MPRRSAGRVFQVRAGHDVAAALTKLDKAAAMDLGLPQYFRGLALAELLPGAGPSEAGHAAAGTGRADQVMPTSSSCSLRVISSRSCCSVPRTRASPAPTWCRA